MYDRDRHGDQRNSRVAVMTVRATIMVSMIVAMVLPVTTNAAQLQAAQVDVTVRWDGKPLALAVVSLHSPQARPDLRAQPAAIDQRDSQFQPHVSVVHVGSPVAFPNSDNVRHQVYSFSPAKRAKTGSGAGSWWLSHLCGAAVSGSVPGS